MASKASNVKTDSYRASYDAAMEELAELMAEREEIDTRAEEIDRRVLRLREAILGLGGLCGKPPFLIARERPELFPDTAVPDVGFTDAVRAVFREERDGYFSPMDIRDLLEMKGFDVSKYKNVLASIHSILKRLKKKNEIVDAIRENKAVYKCDPRGPLAHDPDPPAVELRDEDIPF